MNFNIVSQILNAGKDELTKQFIIPDEYFLSKETILEQLQIICTLFPRNYDALPSAKKPKLQNKEVDSNNEKTSPKASNEPKLQVHLIPIEEPTDQERNRPIIRITANQLKDSLKATLEKV